MINVKAETARLLKDEFNIDPNVTNLLFDKGMLSFTACRNVLINEEYRKKAQAKERQCLRNKIAEKYCVSMSFVEKLTTKKIA
jgi:hypothetical protein